MGIVDVVSVLSEMPTLLKLKKGMVPRPRVRCRLFWRSS